MALGLALAVTVAIGGCPRSKSGSKAAAERGAAHAGVSTGSHAAAAKPGPTIRVTVTDPGLDAVAIERAVTEPLEQAAGQLDGVAALRSESMSGRAVVQVTFGATVGSQAALARLFEALEPVRTQLPPGALPPVLERESRGDPVVYLLRSATGDSSVLSHIDDQDLVPALERLPGVMRVTGCGRVTPALTTTADPDRLAARGLDVADLVRAVSGALGAMAPAPATGADLAALAHVSVTPAHAAQAARGAPANATPAAGSQVRVGDVATVTLDHPADCVAHAGGHAAALIGEVWLDADLPVADRTRTRAAIGQALARAAPALPGGVTLETFTAGEARLLALTLDPVGGADPRELAHRAGAWREALAGLPGVSTALVEVPGTAARGEQTGVRALLVLSRDAGAAPIVHAATAHLPGVAVRAVAGEVAERTLLITGTELDELARLAPRIAEAARGTGGVAAAGVGAGAQTRPTLEIEPDRARLAQLGVSAADLHTTVQAAMTGVPAGTVRRSDQQVPVRVRLVGLAAGPSDVASVLQRVKVATTQGLLVPLAEVARLEARAEPRLILRVDRRRAVELWWRATPGRPFAPIEAALKQRLVSEVPLPAGTSLVWPPPGGPSGAP